MFVYIPVKRFAKQRRICRYFFAACPAVLKGDVDFLATLRAAEGVVFFPVAFVYFDLILVAVLGVVNLL